MIKNGINICWKMYYEYTSATEQVLTSIKTTVFTSSIL